MFKKTKVVGSVLLLLSVMFIIIGLSILSGTDMKHAQAEYDVWYAKYTEWQAAKVEARNAAEKRGLKTSEAIEIAQQQVDHCIYWVLEWQSDIKTHKSRATVLFFLGAISTAAGIVVLALGAKHKEKQDDGGSIVDAKIVKIK